MRRAVRPQAGFTVVELLVSVVVLAIISGIVTSFMAAQWRLAEQTEARNDMQINLRAAMELVVTDIYNAGSKGVQTFCAVGTPALEADTSTARAHTVRVRYCDPYTNNAPRNLLYSIATDPANSNVKTLYRNGIPAVAGILGMELVFTCRTGACGPSTAGFPDKIIAVEVKLAARSPRPVSEISSLYLFDGTPVGGSEQQAGYYYEFAHQTVRPPNLGR